VGERVACRKGGERVCRECPILLIDWEGGWRRVGGWLGVVGGEKASVGVGWRVGWLRGGVRWDGDVTFLEEEADLVAAG